MEVIIVKESETDWWVEYEVLALNRDSRLFEPHSNVSGATIVLCRNMYENEVANILADHIRDVGDYEYTLYNEDLELVGFVYYK